MPQHSELFQKLIDWVDGRLSPTEIEALQEQLKTAEPQTAADLAWLRRFRALSDAITLTPPPAELRQQLITLLDQHRPERQPPSLWQRLTATLTFDSGSQLALAGVRSAAPTPARQLIYSTAITDIVLNIQPQPTPPKLDLYGQIFPLDETNDPLFAVQLLSPQHEEIATSAANELGEFRFPALPTGNYHLIISGDNVELSIDSVDLTLS